MRRDHRIAWLVVSLVTAALFAASARAQVSPEEHAKHHPSQAAKKGPPAGKGPAAKAEAGGMMGGKGMGGGMGGMMEKMGAPKPKEMYPQLMALPDLPLEKRAEIEQEAHQRMLAGTALLSDGLERLAEAASTDDFAAMQEATAILRQGLAQFESGLAAHRAIAEGKAPRNVALQWFKREMNLLPVASSEPGFRIWGMDVFHTAVMVVLTAFTVGAIWMYFFKMRRASALLEHLAAGQDLGASGEAAQPAQTAKPTPPSSSTTAPAAARPPVARSLDTATETTSQTTETSEDECCQQSETPCATETPPVDRLEVSPGLLPVVKRKLCRLRVARIFQETPDVKTFRLVACHGGALPFSYLPGQFLTLTLPVGEKPIRRSYTISSSPTQGYYCEITVKREEHGVGSRYLHDVVKEGDLLEVQAPNGKFVFTGQEADSVVLIAGGVGITPMMSITRALTDMGWSGDIFLIVACRDPEHFIFRDELIRLQRRHRNLHVFVAMSRLQADVEGYHRGRLTKELLAQWVPDIASRRVHLCGAPPMMEATKQMLTELGVPAESIFTESFGSLQKPHAKEAQETVTKQHEAKEDQDKAEAPAGPTVTFEKSGKSTALWPDETLLEAAERVGVEIDYSCRVGMCGVCTVKLVSGQVTMETDDGLDPDDKAAGMILACQAKADADVTIDA
ncbi:MAG: 2Fe-2S iron-sulfur cluster binding domain-containing protein [Planctomycetes bacterium]|nr:2Fe-2S iron-sulfur cluster binding domain-containing protein [Planctomycetota bacterium]